MNGYQKKFVNPLVAVYGTKSYTLLCRRHYTVDAERSEGIYTLFGSL